MMMMMMVMENANRLYEKMIYNAFSLRKRKDDYEWMFTIIEMNKNEAKEEILIFEVYQVCFEDLDEN
jgi:hypothetical protein